MEVVKLVIEMIIAHNSYGDKIGFTRKDIENIYDEYNVLESVEVNKYDILIDLYENKFLSKEKLIKKIREFLEDRDLEEPAEYVEFLEKNNFIDYCIDLMIPDNIKKEGDEWYFYTDGEGWEYFSDYFNIPSGYRDNVVEAILSGDAFELFWYDSCDFDISDSYIDVSAENLKYLKQIIQNMKEDFEIEQEEIDNIKDLSDVVSIINEHDIDDLENGLNSTLCHAQGFADEAEAYESLVEQIIDFFGFGEKVEWVETGKKNHHLFKLNFKNEEAAKNTIINLYKLNHVYDSSEFKMDYDPPYYGYNAGYKKVQEYFDNELQERIPDFVDKYIP